MSDAARAAFADWTDRDLASASWYLGTDAGRTSSQAEHRNGAAGHLDPVGETTQVAGTFQ